MPFLSLLALNYGILNNMRVERARQELWSMSGQLLNMSFAVVNTLSCQGEHILIFLGILLLFTL